MAVSGERGGTGRETSGARGGGGERIQELGRRSWLHLRFQVVQLRAGLEALQEVLLRVLKGKGQLTGTPLPSVTTRSHHRGDDNKQQQQLTF